MEVARHVCDIHGLPVADSSFSDLGRHIKALNNKGNSSKGESAIPMIGSTSLSHAVVLDLSRPMDFSASLAVQQSISTVMEVVVRTTPDMKQEAAPTTVTIVPWIIEETADLALYFRFHHMALDAKPDIVHSIYQQLSVGSNEQADPIQQLQFIVRIITAEKPMWVIDIVGPVGVPNIPAMNRHFTGNASGDSATIILDGIPMQVIAGYGIPNAKHQGFSHSPLVWASLPEATMSLKYLCYLLHHMGMDSQAVVAILYAKPEALRTTSSSRPDRHSLNQKANSTSAPTIIFHSPKFLKTFLDQFPDYVELILPRVIIGHSGGDLPRGQKVELLFKASVTQEEFMDQQQTRKYFSNEKGTRQDLLEHYEEASRPIPPPDYFASIDALLAAAKRSLPSSAFLSGVDRLSKKYRPDMTSGIAFMSLTTVISQPVQGFELDTENVDTGVEVDEPPGGKRVRFVASDSA